MGKVYPTNSHSPWSHLPSTSEVSKVTLAALRLPAGRFSPILSSFSLRDRPPFLDFALHHNRRMVRREGRDLHQDTMLLQKGR